MNIYLHEMKAYMRSALIWAFSMSALAILYIILYKGLGEDIEELKKILNNMPDAMKLILNLYIESISTLAGFYSFVFSFIILCGAIQAMNVGTSIVSKETRDKTSDFLMTKPVGRKKVLTAKLLAALSVLIVTNMIYLVLTVLAALIIVVEFDLKLFLMISVTMFFVQLLFAALGILVSVAAGKIRSVITVSLSTVFGFYIIGSLGSFLGEEKARTLSPFRYFDPAYIIKNASYENVYLILSAVFILLAVTGSYLIYGKKDIHAV